MFPNAEVNDVGTSTWLEADPSGKTKTSQYFFKVFQIIPNKRSQTIWGDIIIFIIVIGVDKVFKPFEHVGLFL